MLNRDLDAERELIRDWRDPAPTRVPACQTLTGTDLTALNTFQQPTLVAPRPLDPPKTDPTMPCTLPPRSYSVAHIATTYGRHAVGNPR